MTDSLNITGMLREKALKEGFDLFGVARSEPLEGHGEIIKKWCRSGMNSDMAYLGRNIEKRTDPSLLFTGARSVIVTGLNYYSERKQGGDGVPVISRYAYGMNYHDVILEKLGHLIEYLKAIHPGADAKAFVDFAPILEKAWARKAGLGWPGRHSVLINRQIGSFFFIGVVLTNVELDYDRPHMEEYCGSCRLCIDACPTAAINTDRTIDTRKCIAYITLESDQPVDEDNAKKFQGRAFGCDICQEACPWNKKAVQNDKPEFQPSAEFLEMTPEDWKEMPKDRFKRMFKRSAIGRKKYQLFIQNVTNVTKSE
jgi:epoxyqueuosine reductase